jgi:shikimate kinase
MVMHPDLEFRRLVLNKTYRRYLAAEEVWLEASREVLTWFPKQTRRAAVTIGNPGSRVRRIYEQRDKALNNLAVARLHLEEGKRRIAEARHPAGPMKVMLVTYLS